MRKSLFLVALFLIATLSFNGVAAQNIAQGVRVVVIDAGHGGRSFRELITEEFMRKISTFRSL